MDVEQTQLEKARVYAYWGFIGFVHPIIGIITSCISISILNRLLMDDSDEEGKGEHARLLGMANAARALSVVMLIAIVIGAIVATTQIVEAVNTNPSNEYYKLLLDSAKN